MHARVVVALLLVTACASDKHPPQPAAKPTESATPTVEPATALAAKAKARVHIDHLGVSIVVPDGTTVTPSHDRDAARRNANLQQGEFMVNVLAADELTTFAKAKEVDKDDKLVSWFRSDETPTGWITFKEVVSSIHEDNRFEVSVRTVVSGNKWDCEISAPSKPLAELALAACQTLQ